MAHPIRFESPASPPCPPLKIVFGGMPGRFTTTPMIEVAREHGLAGIVESPPRAASRGWLVDWARSGEGRGNLARFARHLGCPHLHLSPGAFGPLIDLLDQVGADLLVLSNFSQLLPPQVLERPTLGCLNLHLSALPRHRGPNPWLWMFHDGDQTGGVTVHRLDEGEDTGPVLARWEHPVPPGVTGGALADQVLPEAGRLLSKAVAALASGSGVETPQPAAPALRRARWVRPGERLIDWEAWGAERVWRFLRGASTWYDPVPALPGLRREYTDWSPARTGLAPGRARWGLRGGWLACQDGQVRFRHHPVARELGRLALPLAAAAAALGAL